MLSSTGLFRELPEIARSFADVDFAPAAAACPHGVDIGRMMRRAADVLA